MATYSVAVKSNEPINRGVFSAVPTVDPSPLTLKGFPILRPESDDDRVMEEMQPDDVKELRGEVRQAVREVLEPLRSLVEILERTMRAASQTSARLKGDGVGKPR